VQPLHPNNAQPRIDYSGRTAAHPACTARMEVSRRANVFLDRGLIVSNWTRRQLRFNKSADWSLAHLGPEAPPQKKRRLTTSVKVRGVGRPSSASAVPASLVRF